MSKKKHSGDEETLGFQIAPMIDVIFILILFFMCSAGSIKVETELGIQLPGNVVSTQKLDMPDEQIIEVGPSGEVILDGKRYDTTPGRKLPELVHTLVRFRQLADSSQNQAMVTISADPNARYQRVIDVMNACAEAKIKNVTFNAVDPSADANMVLR